MCNNFRWYIWCFSAFFNVSCRSVFWGASVFVQCHGLIWRFFWHSSDLFQCHFDCCPPVFMYHSIFYYSTISFLSLFQNVTYRFSVHIWHVSAVSFIDASIKTVFISLVCCVAFVYDYVHQSVFHSSLLFSKTLKVNIFTSSEQKLYRYIWTHTSFFNSFFTTNRHKVRKADMEYTVWQRTACTKLAVHLPPFSLHYVHVSVNFLLLVWNYCFIWLPFLGQTYCLKRLSVLQSSIFTFANFCNTCQQGLSHNW